MIDGYLSVLLIDKQQIINNLKRFVLIDGNVQQIIDILSESDFFSFLKMVGELINNENFDLENSYIYTLGIVDLYYKIVDMFKFCFKEDVFDKISNNEEFEEYRDLIMEINCIFYEKPNPNPEIEKFKRYERIMQEKKHGKVTFESMYTSVGLALGKDPDYMTLYKFHKYFERLMQFKNNEATTLFATVSDKIEIVPWYQHIEKEEEEYITEQQLMKNSQKDL